MAPTLDIDGKVHIGKYGTGKTRPYYVIQDRETGDMLTVDAVFAEKMARWILNPSE